MTTREETLYRFGDFTLEPGERRLWRGGAPVALTPKAFELLVCLVERAGHAVSKDELLEALWPGRIVMESNLTKHIWHLRKALGDDQDEGRLIQTVSKHGYRFAAPVSGETAAPRPAAVNPATRRPAWLAAVGLIAAAAVAGLTFAALRGDPPAAATRPGTVAVVGLNNLSQQGADAWVGPALTEMVATDIALDGKVRALPDELVRPAREDIALPVAGGFGRETLARLRRRLAADYVITGGYLISDGPGAATLRMDFTVQDARSGATVATLSRTGAVSDLPAMATGAGAELRRDLGGHVAGVELAAAAGPPTVEVMRHIGQGLEALHQYDGARARDEFLEAVAQAPAYAPAYADLSQAWASLGYRARALAAAQQAAAHAGGLPPLLRLRISEASREAQYDWKGAAADLRSLIALTPADPEPRLRLVDVLLSAGKPTEAGAAVDGLRTVAGSNRGDPRLELAAVRIAAARDDANGRIAHASRALALARARDLRALTAEAEIQLGIAHSDGQPKAAAAELAQARDDFHAVGNPHGEAWALQNLGNLFADSDPARARQDYQSALAQYQQIGDLSGAAAIYSDFAILLWQAGDRDGAETAVRHVLDIRRQTEDIGGQAWALAALAVQQSDEAASDEAIDNFHRAIALDEAAEARGHLGFALFSLSDDLRERGALGEAARTCAQAQKAYTGPPNAPGRAPVDFECAQIALDLGNVAAARSGLARARAEAAAHGDVMSLANVDMTNGQIEMGLGHWPAAYTLIGAADRELAHSDMVAGQATTASLLALCDAALGRAADRDRLTARARQLRSRANQRQEVIQTDIDLAQLRGLAGDRAGAVATLRRLADDAARRRWLGWSLEARLAAARLSANPADRAALLATARKAGYGWVVSRVSPVAITSSSMPGWPGFPSDRRTRRRPW
ncbi:MAG TPA: winged helix-turn-helix domain-containing protein [Caulobacteraceae bacterium]